MRRRNYSQIALPWQIKASIALAAVVTSTLLVSLFSTLFTNLMNNAFGMLFVRMNVASPDIFIPGIFFPLLLIALVSLSIRFYFVFSGAVKRLLEFA